MIKQNTHEFIILKATKTIALLSIIHIFFTFSLMGYTNSKKNRIISKSVLNDVIGIAIIDENSRLSKRPVDPFMKCFVKEQTKFIPISSVEYKETIPLDHSFKIYYKYWITNQEVQYLQIVIDPFKDKRVWIEMEKYDSYYIYPEKVKHNL